MASDLTAELHDLMKLAVSELPLNKDGSFVHTHGEWSESRGLPFEKLDWNALGVEPLQNLIWWGIVYHLDKDVIDKKIGEFKHRTWVRDLTLPCPNPRITDNDRVALFLLVLSDHFAATVGRASGEGYGVELKTSVRRLWNPAFLSSMSSHVEPISDAHQLKQALQLIATNDAGKIWEKYKTDMAVKPEDEETPRNVTSLLSHSELAGKFYRLLKQHSVQLDDPLRLSLDGEIVLTTSEAEAKWKCRLVRALVRFNQQPARPADLGIFQRLQDTHEAFAAKNPDHLLFAAGDTLWLLAPSEDLVRLDDLLSVYTHAGFYILVDAQEAALRDLKVWHSETAVDEHDLGNVWQVEKARLQKEIATRRGRVAAWERQYETLEQQIQAAPRQAKAELGKQKEQLGHERGKAQREIALLEKELTEGDRNFAKLPADQLERYSSALAFYPPDLGQDFEPPLCEICQMQHGYAVKVRKATDYLCKGCREIREKGFHQRDLGDLLESEQTKEEDERAETRTQFLWLKVNLDADGLESTLAAWFREYVDAVRKQDGTLLPVWQRLLLKHEMRLPAVLRDFVSDYSQLLEEFNEQIRRVFRIKAKARLTPETWVTPISNGEDVREALTIYAKPCREHFPKFFGSAELIKPCIQLGISIAPAKFPFYEQWRYISAPPKPVSVRLAGRAQLETTLSGLTGLLERMGAEDTFQQTFLNRVATIERRTGSRILTQAAFFEEDEFRRRKEKPPLPVIELLKSGTVTAEQILAFRKLTDWR